MFGRNLIMGATRAQGFWSYIHLLSLRGMSVGAGSHVAESGERRVLEQLRDSARADRDITVFDVGANRGDYAVAALTTLGGRRSSSLFRAVETRFPRTRGTHRQRTRRGAGQHGTQ